jgi:thioredoxin-like negative regulator of GroEL
MAMFSKNRLPAGSPLTKEVYSAYEQNLERIVESAGKHGIETILCTVAVNLRDCPPFGSAHGRILTEEETTAWQAAFDSGKSAAAAGRHTDAAQDFTEALRIDPDHAEVNYLAAISAEESGDATIAAQHYSRARDLDTLRVRTDSQMNALVRSVAAKSGTKFIECDEVFGAAPGAESFVDHVHFTLEGVALLANAVAEQIDSGRERVDTETLSKRLDHDDWSKRKLSTIMLQRLESIPFAGQTGNSERLAKWQSQRESLNGTVNATGADRVLADFGDRQLDYPWDHEYAIQSLHHLAAVGAWSQAASLADRIRPQMRGASAANGLLAVVYARAKRPEDAADVLTSTGPPYGYFLVDAAFQLLGSLDDAEGKGIACTVVTSILQKAGEFPGKAALVQWLKENDT